MNISPTLIESDDSRRQNRLKWWRLIWRTQPNWPTKNKIYTRGVLSQSVASAKSCTFFIASIAFPLSHLRWRQNECAVTECRFPRINWNSRLLNIVHHRLNWESDLFWLSYPSDQPSNLGKTWCVSCRYQWSNLAQVNKHKLYPQCDRSLGIMTIATIWIAPFETLTPGNWSTQSHRTTKGAHPVWPPSVSCAVHAVFVFHYLGRLFRRSGTSPVSNYRNTILFIAQCRLFQLQLRVFLFRVAHPPNPPCTVESRG